MLEYRSDEVFRNCNSLTEVILSEEELFDSDVLSRTKNEQQRKLANGLCPNCGGKLSFFGKRCKICRLKW